MHLDPHWTEADPDPTVRKPLPSFSGVQFEHSKGDYDDDGAHAQPHDQRGSGVYYALHLQPREGEGNSCEDQRNRDVRHRAPSATQRVYRHYVSLWVLHGVTTYLFGEFPRR